MRDLYNLQIGFRAAIYRLYRYSTPARALRPIQGGHGQGGPQVPLLGHGDKIETTNLACRSYW